MGDQVSTPAISLQLTEYLCYRAACSTDAVHAPFVAGIAGSATDGAYSVALSGGYDDDVDLGYGLWV